MAIRKYNPTSPGVRGKTSLTFDEITTNEPHASADREAATAPAAATTRAT